MKNLIIISAIGVIIAMTSVFLSAQKRDLSPAIQGTTDLNTAAAELDKDDLSGFDKELDLLNADVTKF